MTFIVPDGATPILDIGDLKQEGIVTYAQLCAAEAENILNATRKYLLGRRSLNKDFVNERTLLKIHREMFKEVWRWAGKYRCSITNIGVKPYLIPHEILKLCQDIQLWIANPECVSVLEHSARLHHRLVLIHPFENGNGRHARLIADIYLNLHGAQFPSWPIDLTNNGLSRNAYINSLKEADNGNYEPLIRFMITHGASL